jgi:hypothetical protein
LSKRDMTGRQMRQVMPASLAVATLKPRAYVLQWRMNAAVSTEATRINPQCFNGPAITLPFAEPLARRRSDQKTGHDC